MVFPPPFRETGEEHEVQGINFRFCTSSEIVAEEKGLFPEADRDAELYHDSFVGRGAVHDGKNTVRLENSFRSACPTLYAHPDAVKSI